MKPGRSSRRVNHVLVLAIILGSLTLAGCGAMYGPTGDFDGNGIPHKKYLVGGGLQIEWTAPQPGTAYLIETHTSKIIMTKSLDTDEEIEFSAESAEPEFVKRALGMELSELKFSLYFIPKKEMVTQ